MILSRLILCGLSLLIGSVLWDANAHGPLPGVESRSATRSSANIEIIRDRPYVEGPWADPAKHKLDLYLPAGRRDFPILVFVHGGGWSHGDKKFWFDLYGKLGKTLAGQGIAVAVINYRLAPRHLHPDQARDVARAVAWVHSRIARFGGNPGRLFLAGHSAGGHLISLIACDPQYLAEVGLGFSAIAGVIPVSGVFDVRPENLLFNRVFGTDSREKAQASPLTHVKAGLPPFLILHGDQELPYCGDEWARRFHDRLLQAGVSARRCPIADRDHLTIIAKISEPDDPALQAIVEFIRSSPR
jgi:acetyl esterase/lipase